MKNASIPELSFVGKTTLELMFNAIQEFSLFV